MTDKIPDLKATPENGCNEMAAGHENTDPAAQIPTNRPVARKSSQKSLRGLGSFLKPKKTENICLNELDQ